MRQDLSKAAKRLEQYTESVREINQLNDIEICRIQISASEFFTELTDDLTVMATEAGKTLQVTDSVASGMISIDTSILHRVMENIINNALRFTKERIELSFMLQDKMLTISVSDDGCGFSDEVLNNRNRLLIPTTDENNHCGMGLTISRLLCQKHGGRLELANRQPHGATVKIVFAV